jgi:polysaccharide pyruvyl transferase WcaK-like protein
LRCGTKLTVATISAAGSGNYGDELIRKLWLDFYRNLNVLDISFLPRTDQDGKSYEFVSLEEFWNNTVDFSNVDLIHFLGGGYINDEFETISDYTKVISSLRNMPLIASGVSLQPSRAENLQNFLNQNWKLMGLRDFESYLPARQILGKRASWSFDDTWKFPIKKNLLKVQSTEKRIFLNLQQQFNLSDSIDYESISAKLINFISEAQRVNPELKITVIEAHKSDSKLQIDLGKFYKNIEVVKAEEWLAAPLRYSDQDMVISSRFHPRLLFSRVGVKVKFIPVGDYYKLKHDDQKGKIFFQSDSDLSQAFSFESRTMAFYLWRINCLCRAKVFKLKIKRVLISILIVKIFNRLGAFLLKN